MRKINAAKHEKWKDLIIKQKSSGISVRQYCLDNDLPFHQFRYFKKKYFPGRAPKSAFVKVVPKSPSSPSSPSSTPRVTLKHNDLSICFEGDFENSKISSLYLALRGKS